MMRDLLRITLWRQQKERKLPDMGPSSYPPPTGATQDTLEANFEDWSRLFSTPNQQADPTFQTPVATRRPGRDVGPPDRHTYPTDHVHA
ncbi:hypothetical protein PVAP13_9KG498326 [Panicum virgatum]|uniref:Uncharacterized protein n=1 Tax=Panicum virgatum TaxID=38727 RepID=A0A8T0P1L6_PANVG|nr:hypothetical protein PVAP13_9KG498326 [Panicum virgatum]